MRVLNEAAVRYITYQSLLESGLDYRTRERLIEAGMLQKVMAWLGAGAETVKDAPAAILALWKNKKFTKRAVVAEKNIQKEIDELIAIAEDAGHSKEEVLYILKSILDKAGASTDDIQAAVDNPPEGGGDTEGKESNSGVPNVTPPGQPVRTDSVPGQRAMAAAAAAAAGQNPEQQAAAADNAEEKKIDPEKLIGTLGKLIGKQHNVDGSKAAQVIKALLDSGAILTENRRRARKSDFINAINEMKQRTVILERWQQLAGLNRRKTSSFLFEGAAEDITKEIESKKIKDFDGLKAAMSGLSDDEKKDVEKNVETVKKAYTDAKAKDADKFDDAFKEALKQSAGKDAGGAKEAKAAKEKYPKTFEAVKSKVKDITDEELATILNAIDSTEILKIK